MPASHSTLKETALRIEKWRRKYRISPEALSELLMRLATVPGNSSFRITVSRLQTDYHALIEGIEEQIEDDEELKRSVLG